MNTMVKIIANIQRLTIVIEFNTTGLYSVYLMY